MICGNCGAEIDDKLTACPYCGAMQYETSEEKYMKDLYNLNDGMEKLEQAKVSKNIFVNKDPPAFEKKAA